MKQVSLTEIRHGNRVFVFKFPIHCQMECKNEGLWSLFMPTFEIRVYDKDKHKLSSLLSYEFARLYDASHEKTVDEYLKLICTLMDGVVKEVKVAGSGFRRDGSQEQESSRKVRAPQDRTVGNNHPGVTSGSVQQKTNRQRPGQSNRPGTGKGETAG